MRNMAKGCLLHSWDPPGPIDGLVKANSTLENHDSIEEHEQPKVLREYFPNENMNMTKCR